MPFTPFHFGPGVVFLACAPRRFSLWAFCAANVVMDIEPGILLMLERFPLHRFMHTIPGAVTAVTATSVFFGVWSKLPESKRPRTVLLPPKIPPSKVGLGAILGAGSHLFLDGMMHDDMRPFWPLTSENPLLGRLHLATIHVGCVIAAVLGGIAHVWFSSRKRPPRIA